MFRWIQIIAEDSDQYKRYKKGNLVPRSGYHYKGCNPNDESNGFFELVEYHVSIQPQFEDIVNKNGEKGHFGGLLSVRMKLVERP